MFGVFPLTGANGRDYSNRADLEKDFRAGKDFLTAAGKHCSIRDFAKGAVISFRYAQLRKAVSFTIRATKTKRRAQARRCVRNSLLRSL